MKSQFPFFSAITVGIKCCGSKELFRFPKLFNSRGYAAVIGGVIGVCIGGAIGNEKAMAIAGVSMMFLGIGSAEYLRAYTFAIRTSTDILKTHLVQLNHVVDELQRLRVFQLTNENWLEYLDMWSGLYQYLELLDPNYETNDPTTWKNIEKKEMKDAAKKLEGTQTQRLTSKRIIAEQELKVADRDKHKIDNDAERFTSNSQFATMEDTSAKLERSAGEAQIYAKQAATAANYARRKAVVSGWASRKEVVYNNRVAVFVLKELLHPVANSFDVQSGSGAKWEHITHYWQGPVRTMEAIAQIRMCFTGGPPPYGMVNALGDMGRGLHTNKFLDCAYDA